MSPKSAKRKSSSSTDSKLATLQRHAANPKKWEADALARMASSEQAGAHTAASDSTDSFGAGAADVPHSLFFFRQAPAWVKKSLHSLKGKPVLLTFHSLADLDACASALALAEELGPHAVIAPPDRLNSESRRLLGTQVKGWPSFEQARQQHPNAPVILLDANDPSILPQFKPKISVDILIDHHAPQDGSISSPVSWIDPDASSTCELVAHFIARPSPEQARALVLGILSDSARLVRADAETFAILSRLLRECPQSYEDLLTELEQPASPASRAAVLEGLRQATWLTEGSWVVATASVSSHESHVADALVRSGADVAFVGCSDSHGVRLSARLRPALSRRVHLPFLCHQLGSLLGGSGGGHPSAAGANGPRAEKLEEALRLAQQLFLAEMAK